MKSLCMFYRLVDVNCRDAYGQTALHLVSKDDNVESAKLLLEGGAGKRTKLARAACSHKGKGMEGEQI